MTFTDLGQVVEDESFPVVDMALRRGRHVHKDDETWFAFLTEAHLLLDGFYRRYGCELVQRSDGYFFLLPLGDDFGKRQLSIAEMIVGQGLALAYLDPKSMERGGVIDKAELLGQLAAVMGTDALMRSLNPKRKRVDERIMQRTVRQKVNDALRRLEQLGFVELLEEEKLRLPPSLMRFAEPVRGLEAPSEALAKLLERGEISLATGDDESSDDDGADHLDATDDDAAPEMDAAAEVAAAVAVDAALDDAPAVAVDGSPSQRLADDSISLDDLAKGFDDLDWDTPSEDS